MYKPLSVLTLAGVALSIAAMCSGVRAEDMELQDNAPDHYTVVKGDTLWDISGKFLKNPWLWSQIWQLNKDSIKDPHWIYPGDTVILDRSSGQPRLQLQPGEQHGLPVVKLSPYAREEVIESGAIPTIPISAIHAFLAKPRVIEAGEMDHAPYILGSDADRVVFGKNDDVFATGGPAKVTSWNILRPGKALKDPETGNVLGYEVEYIGDARTLVPGAPQELRITQASQEVQVNDKLAPADDTTTFEYVPRAPEKQVTGRIISAYGSVSDTGRMQTVVINRGTGAGLAPGDVLAVYRTGKTIKLNKKEQESTAWVKKSADGKARKDGEAWMYGDDGQDRVKLPDARTGLIMVYRVFDKVAYALVVQSDEPIRLLDTVKNP